MSVDPTDLDIVYKDVRFVRTNAEALGIVQIGWTVVIIATGLYFIPYGILANIHSPWQIGQQHAPTPTFPEILLVPGWTWLWRVPAILATAISAVNWCRFEVYILVERETDWPQLRSLEHLNRHSQLKCLRRAWRMELLASTSVTIWLFWPNAAFFGIPIPAYSCVMTSIEMFLSWMSRVVEEEAAAVAHKVDVTRIDEAPYRSARGCYITQTTAQEDLHKLWGMVAALVLYWANRPTSTVYLAIHNTLLYPILRLGAELTFGYAAAFAPNFFAAGLVVDVELLHDRLIDALREPADEWPVEEKNLDEKQTLVGDSQNVFNEKEGFRSISPRQEEETGTAL